MPARTTDPRVARLVAAYEALRPETLPDLLVLYAGQARFTDPFNDVVGQAGIERIFRHMFDALVDPRFVVQLAVVQGDDAFLTWRFSFRLRRAGASIAIVGATHLRYDAEGRVILHRDYWDAAQEWYARLPLVGAAVGWSRRWFSASHRS